MKVGEFTVVADLAAARLDILAPDGRPLLEGLGAAAIPDDGPPLTGFAVRDVEMNYRMMFGSFKPADEVKGPWIAAESLKAGSDGGTISVSLHGKKGVRLASMRGGEGREARSGSRDRIRNA